MGRGGARLFGAGGFFRGRYRGPCFRGTGPPTEIKDVVIEGNEKTKDFVIERELSFKPGDLVNVQQIDASLRRVLMLGFRGNQQRFLR